MNLTLREKQQTFLAQGIYSLLILIVVGISLSIAVSSIALGAALFLLLTIMVLSKEKIFQPTPLDYFFLAYAFSELLATMFSNEPAASLLNMKRLFLIAVVYLTVFSMNTKQKFEWFLVLLFGTTAFLSVIEVILVPTIGEHISRLAVFQHYMTAGGLKMFILLLLLPFIAEKTAPLKLRLLALSASLPTFIALIFTQTRSSWLGFFAGGIAVGALKNKKLLIALPVGIALFLLFAPHDFQSRAASIFDPTLGSNRTRIQMITTGWHMFLDRPIFGTGDIDLKQLYVTYTEPIDPAEGGHLHNNLMMLLVTLGAVGFAAVMALFIKILLVEWNAFKQTKHHWLFGSVTLGCIAAYIGFHVNGLFEWNFGDHEIAVLLWFTVGLTLASQKVVQQSSIAETT